MYLKKYLAAASAVLMAAGMPIGVFAEEAATEAEVSEEEVEEKSEFQITVGGETEYPVTVCNSDGTEVVIEKEPETVISLGPNITEMIYEIGAEDKLIARTDYCDYPEEVTELPSIGTLYDVDVEAVLSMEPDLVVASTHISDDLMAQLTDAGITVLYLYEEYDIEGVYTMIETLGTAVNCQDDAADVVEAMMDIMDFVSESLEGTDPVSIYYVVSFGEYGDYTAGGDTFINGILEAAGGANIAADVEGWSYSAETLLEKDPEYVLLADYNYDSFMTTEPYSNLTAVKEGNVLTIDTDMLDRQCARNAAAVLELAIMLHPECFEEYIEEEMSAEE